MKKICFISSCGGHLMEIKQLFPIAEGFDFYIVTENNPASYEIVDKFRHYYLKQQERKNIRFLWNFIYNIIFSLRILLKEKPNIILSTGAGCTFPTLLLGKILKAKIIYIESFAKLTNKSMTGKLTYYFADYFFVQWEEMKYIYKNSIYAGQVY